MQSTLTQFGFPEVRFVPRERPHAVPHKQSTLDVWLNTSTKKSAGRDKVTAADVTMEGVAVSLPGASSFGAGCICHAEGRQWMRRNDVFQTTKCMRCDRSWHVCPVHRVEVAGMPKPVTSSQCSCNKPWMPSGSNCPNCHSTQFQQPFDGTTTRVCQQCRGVYHVCPMDGNAVKGPGYPLTAREQSMCQCHQNPSFLGRQWSTPFQ